jgi:hypothetical protein
MKIASFLLAGVTSLGSNAVAVEALPSWAARATNSGVVQMAVAPPTDARWTHLGWPKAVRTPAGTIVLAYLAGETHAGAGSSPVVSLSTDAGRTFTPPRVLREFSANTEYTASGNVAAGLTVENAIIVLAMAYRGNEGNNIYGWRSQDEGRTWQEVDTSQLGPNKTGSVAGNIIQLPGQKLMVMGHYRKGAKPYDTGIWQSVSKDHGRSWSAPIMVTNIEGVEPVLVRARDRLLVFIRGRGQAAARQYIAVSDDFGETWRVQLSGIVAQSPHTTDLAHPFAMLDPSDPAKLVVVTAERPVPGSIWLWHGSADQLDFKVDRKLLDVPKIEGSRNTDYGYTWLLPVDGRRCLMFYYHGMSNGPNAIWVTEVKI